MKTEIMQNFESFPSEVVIIPKFLLKMINSELKKRTEDKNKQKASVITLFGEKSD
jgi:hypothetical protein